MSVAAEAVQGSRAGIPLEIAHRTEIESRLALLRNSLGDECPSEYTFANLYLFRTVHDYRYLPGLYPCISGITYDGKRHLLPLFDISDVAPETLAAVLSGHECFFPVSGKYLSTLDSGRFCWHAVADDADYLYPALNFLCYKGQRLRRQRAAVTQLLTAVPGIETHILTPARASDAKRVLKQWLLDKGKHAGEADEPACTGALQLMGELGLEGFVHYAGTNPIGFLIAETLAPGSSVIHFAKGVGSHNGIFPYMFQHYCASRAPRLRLLNFEQDLGLSKLRRTKRSYLPSRLVDKYRVCLKPAQS